MIVFCHLLNDSSGSPTVLKETIKASELPGVLFVGSHGRGVLESADLPIRRYWYRRSRYRIFTLISYLFSQLQLYRALSNYSLPSRAVIYVNTLLPFGAALWGRINGRKVIYHIHEVSLSPKLLQLFLVRIAKKTADRVIYVSKDNRDRLLIPGVPAEVIPNPVPEWLAVKSRESEYQPKRGRQFNILMLASARDYKGIPEFLELARRLLDRSEISFRLVLNADRQEVEQYLSATQIPRNLVVLPRSDRPDEFYRQAGLVVNLSRVDQWIETFGLTLVEAMSFGIPVIAPPIGGPLEIVTDGQEGYLVDSRDIDTLEQKVRFLAGAPHVLMEMSERARQRANKYGFDRFASRMNRALASVEP